MAYSIKLQSPDGSTETFECDADTFILDALEEAGLELRSLFSLRDFTNGKNE